jgi:hypothetical protein
VSTSRGWYNNNQKLPATNSQRFGTFLPTIGGKVEGLSRFAKEDLRQYFGKATQLSTPKITTETINKLLWLGWIYDDHADS